MSQYYSHLPTQTKQIAARHWLNHTEVGTSPTELFYD